MKCQMIRLFSTILYKALFQVLSRAWIVKRNLRHIILLCYMRYTSFDTPKALSQVQYRSHWLNREHLPKLSVC